MSRKYRILRQASIGSEFADVDTALAGLARQQPDLAKALQRVDWAAVRAEVARDAIAQVAQQRGVSLRDESVMAHWKTDGGATLHGECVGVMDVGGGVAVALFIAEDRIDLAWSEQHYAHDTQLNTAQRAAKAAAMPHAVQQLQLELSAAYRERAMDARLRIGGRTVTRDVLPSGAVRLTAVTVVKAGGGS